MRISGSRHLCRAAAWALAAALLACRSGGEAGESNASGSDPLVLNLPAIPEPAPPMDREDLLAAIARAASAAFAGADDVQAQRALDGSPFELRIRFGCGGPDVTAFDAGLGWTFDGEDRTLRVRARPTISGDDPIVTRVVGAVANGIEAVEGFWIPRPWLLEPACPSGSRAWPGQRSGDLDAVGQAVPSTEHGAEVTGKTPPSFPKVGIAQFFTEAEPRTRRRQARAYETVKIAGLNERPSASGLDLVLSGRLRSLAGGRVIACVPAGADAPPNCVASADFDQVRIERAGTGDVLAQWESG